MKKIIAIFCLLLPFAAFAQDNPLAQGKSIFVELSSKNESANEAKTEIIDRLNEWKHWTVTEDRSAADLIAKLDIEASKGITATSWGGTSIGGKVTITDKGDKVLWESDTYKSSPNGTNGFNSKKAVANKIIRALKKKVGK
ncbi:MAG: hypothetical protein INR69_16560 [Mucilaginibacter polytrichastri]|nr:hypothetical protein [Mucilaginibacter polytrichastri]